MEKEKLINASKLKEIFKAVFEVFEKYNLNRGEIEFMASEIKKMVEKFETQKEIKEALNNQKD